MPRQRVDTGATTWQDLAECVPAWEAEKGVRVAVTIAWTERLRDGAYVEVVLNDAALALGTGELHRVRAPFPTRKASGQPGAVLYAIFTALNDLDANPWYWSTKMRKDASLPA